MQPIDVIILAGGAGTRLQSISNGKPKSLMPLASDRSDDRVFLDYLLEWLSHYRLRKVFLSLHHQADQFEKYLKSRKSKLDITPIVEPSPRGTGGAVKFILDQATVTESFIVLNGDTLLDFDIDQLCKEAQSNLTATIALAYVEDTARYGKVDFQGTLATRFLEKTDSSPGWINSGCSIIQKQAFNNMPDVFSIEKDIYPKLVQKNLLGIYQTQGMFIDIGIPSDYERLQRMVANKT